MIKKRKILFECEDIDNCEILIDSEIDITNNNELFKNWKLTTDEQKQCDLLNKGYTIKEIAKLLKVASSTIYQRNSKIKEKILNYNIKMA